MTFEQFLKEYSTHISIGVFVLIVIVLALYFLLPLFRAKKPTPEPLKSVEKNDFNLALGGEDNVKSLQLNGSRLSVELNDMTKFDKDKLKKLGVVRIITMKTKLILLVDASFNKVTK